MFDQPRRRFAAIRVVAALTLLLVTSLAAPNAAASPACDLPVAFNPADFSNPTKIDNPLLPYIPGTQMVWEGTQDVAGKTTPHRLTAVVTDLTKVIAGVRTVVVWEIDVREGLTLESEVAFFAQDDTGNVWKLGQYPEEFLNGKFAGAPNTWAGGLDGAMPGIHMLAQPELGGNYYSQGRVDSIAFWDCGQVDEVGAQASTPFGNYSDVTVINEWAPPDRDNAIQRKFHAPGVGVVLVTAINDPEAETLVMLDFKQLDTTAMDAARDEVLRLEGRAYENSQVWRQTPPAELPASLVALPVSGPAVLPASGAAVTGGAQSAVVGVGTSALGVVGTYVQHPIIEGAAPPDADCSSGAHTGRIVVRPDGPVNLYVCTGAGGWIGK
jgi:hypothetical protein